MHPLSAQLAELAVGQAAAAAVFDAVVALLEVGLHHAVAAAHVILAGGAALAITAVVDAVVALLERRLRHGVAAARADGAARCAAAVGAGVDAIVAGLAGACLAVATERCQRAIGVAAAGVAGVARDAEVAGFVARDHAVATAGRAQAAPSGE